MAKKILQKRSLIANTAPNVGELDLGELAINAYDGRLYLKRAYLDPLGDPTEEIVQIGGRIPVENTLFVTEDGDDDREGTSPEESFASIEKAVQVATARGELCLIDVGPGVYFTQGHIDVPDDTVIKCVHRTAIIKPEPGYEERNVFRLGSGCFIEGFLFEGFRVDDMDNPTEGFAVSFRPGAMITRAPYAHKIAVRSIRTWDYVAPPLDRNNANPLVGIGGGVALADGLVCSPYSIYPNIMTWGATPVVHNGIGYCAKNGALINAVNAVSLWAHKHFYAIDGGQIILSSCSTQFGDYTLVSKGSRSLVYPQEIEDVQVIDVIPFSTIQILSPTLSATSPYVATSLASEINAQKTTIINNMWSDLVAQGYTTTWTAEDETYTRRDAETFLDSMIRSLQTGSESYMLNFARGMFYADGTKVYSIDKQPAFIHSWEYMRDQVKALPSAASFEDGLINDLVAALVTTVTTPVFSSLVLSVQTADAVTINAAKTTISNNVWSALVAEGLVTGWSLELENFTKRDTLTLIDAIVNCLNTANEKYITNFVKALFTSGSPVYDPDNLEAFIFSFNTIRDQINSLSVSSQTKTIVSGITNCINYTLRYPTYSTPTLSIQTAAATAITNAKTTIINNLWNNLVSKGYVTGWTSADETYTRRDANNFLQCIIWVLQSANEKPMIDFARGLFDTDGNKVYDIAKQSAFFYSFNYMREQIRLLVNDTAAGIVDGLITALTTTLTTPVFRVEPSTITAIGHTFTGVLAGVALTKIPPVRNQANIQDSILEVGQGVVIASGQDDQGSAIFVGGMEINADTGELSGPPFDQAVNRIATKTAISRSF